MRTTRRFVLGASAATACALSFPAAAQGNDERTFLFIILRGGMDGLGAAPAIGDPDHARVRGVLAPPNPLPLDSVFALNSALANVHQLYQQREALLVHAVATGYRDRSHFDAQNMLETGGDHPFARPEGWLNNLLASLPASAKQGRAEIGVALQSQAPLILRGAEAVATWSPSALPDVQADTIARLGALYRQADPALASALESAVAANALAAGADARNRDEGSPRAGAALARVAATFLKRPGGPLAAVLEINGWDTHTNQAGPYSPLTRNLTQLDHCIAAFKTEMGEHWASTLVIAATEFGRTVAPNGANGADHGTASCAFIAGGGVNGGRVIADWPGLGAGALYEGRDLRPTTDLRAILKGALGDHFRVSRAALDEAVFPGSAQVAPIRDILSA